jgi:hypothetical protein
VISEGDIYRGDSYNEVYYPKTLDEGKIGASQFKVVKVAVVIGQLNPQILTFEYEVSMSKPVPVNVIVFPPA